MRGVENQPERTRSFPKTRRMQRPGEFARLKEEGRRQALGCLIFNWQVIPPNAGSAGSQTSGGGFTPTRQGTRLGVVTSRSVGRAVDRNRARRLLREVFRHHQSALTQPARIVMVARTSINKRSYAGVERDFLEALRRSGLTQATLHHSPTPQLPK